MSHYCQNSLKMDQIMHNDKNGWKDKMSGDDEDRQLDSINEQWNVLTALSKMCVKHERQKE